MPYGVVPVITIDGHQGVESCAILRYVGKLADLYPTDPLQALFVDEVIDIIESVARCLDRYHGPDKARLIAERTQCAEKDFPYLLGTLEKRLQAFGKGAYVVGNTISVADVAIASLIRNVKLERWLYLPKQCVDSYTTMNSISENVYAHPNAVAYCKRLENKKYMLV